ncbi:hypothetical protein Anas_11831 [Armadillidium nasatum]|uniref:RING-type domain-containing protein n=1 Tax=Armadillidium nasatum TaxID=96803 RepID=A0A5N5TG14_9CRUS|nr:hypothetical protein Anas_11831 [Armadillidium nasatum]
MNANKCVLCVEDYSTEKHVPKVLNCGHTFCLPCLSDFVSFVLACPTCNATIEELPTHLPTNYALLNIDSTKDSCTFEMQKKKLINLADETQKQLSKNIENLTQLKDEISYFIEVLNLWDPEEENIKEFDKNFQDKKERLESIRLELYSFYKPEIKPAITLGNCSTKDEFICEIVIELFKKKKIYAFQSEWYNKKILWAKLSYKEGKLYIHAFTEDLPPYPSLFVPFKDLKKCLSVDNFHAFIDICGDHLVCKMLTSNKETRNFIKHCTGEEGKSLRGLNSKIKMFPHLGHGVIEIGIEEANIKEDDYEFLDSLPSETEETFETLLQVKMYNGRCEIVKNPYYLTSMEIQPEEVVVASALSNNVFSDLSDHVARVEDCGILVLLPLSQSFVKKNLTQQFKLVLLNDNCSK